MIGCSIMEIKINKADLIENKIIEISKSPKILLYFDGNQYYAFNGICPHAKWPLELGKVKSKTLICGGHGWEFNIENGKCYTNPGRNLKTYKVFKKDDSIFIKY